MINPIRYVRRVRDYFKLKHWTAGMVAVSMVRSAATHLGINSVWLMHLYKRTGQRMIDRRFKVGDHWDVKGAKVGWLSFANFEDVMLHYAYLDDRHDAKLIERVDKLVIDGDYQYADDDVKVEIHAGDIVIDAGAEFGDFAAICAAKGATVYAFEPVESTFKELQRTAELNKGNKGRIIPVKMGLSDREGEIMIETTQGCPSYLREGNERIEITTLDAFVEREGLARVDFIKADIEGAERDLLRGAVKTMQRFAPALSICTYHLPDDPQVLAQIIRETNPAYKIVQRRKKIAASAG